MLFSLKITLLIVLKSHCISGRNNSPPYCDALTDNVKISHPDGHKSESVDLPEPSETKDGSYRILTSPFLRTGTGSLHKS